MGLIYQRCQGVHTQAKKVSDIEMMVKDATSLLYNIDEKDIEITAINFKLPEKQQDLVEKAKILRQEAKLLRS